MAAVIGSPGVEADPVLIPAVAISAVILAGCLALMGAGALALGACASVPFNDRALRIGLRSVALRVVQPVSRALPLRFGDDQRPRRRRATRALGCRRVGVDHRCSGRGFGHCPETGSSQTRWRAASWRFAPRRDRKLGAWWYTTRTDRDRDQRGRPDCRGSWRPRRGNPWRRETSLKHRAPCLNALVPVARDRASDSASVAGASRPISGGRRGCVWRWPRPERFARMSPERFESYIRSIGLDHEVREALAEYDGGSHQARLGAGVQAAEGVPDERRDPTLAGTRRGVADIGGPRPLGGSLETLGPPRSAASWKDVSRILMATGCPPRVPR